MARLLDAAGLNFALFRIKQALVESVELLKHAFNF